MGNVLWRLFSPDGSPSRNAANALPDSTLPVPPSTEVKSLSKSNNPAPGPGMYVSRRIFLKWAPILNVCVPINFEWLPLKVSDLQLSCVGFAAPRGRFV